MKKTTLLLPVFLFYLLNCSSSPTNPSVLSTETWRCNDLTTPSHIDLVLSKMSNAGVQASGTFSYLFYGDTITGIISSGAATVIDTAVTITASGNASYPPSVTGAGASSAFNLNMSGIFRDSVASGTWSIVFSDTLWQGWVTPGRFSGRLQSGGGVTAQK